MTDRLAAFLSEAGLDARLIGLDRPARTVPDAARLLDTAPTQVVKSIVVTGLEGAAAVLVVAGTARADLDAAARVLGRPALRMASPAAARAATGYAIGGTPPVGHATPLPVIVDERVAAMELVYGGGGRPERLLAIRPEAILEAAAARVADIAEEDP